MNDANLIINVLVLILVTISVFLNISTCLFLVKFVELFQAKKEEKIEEADIISLREYR